MRLSLFILLLNFQNLQSVNYIDYQKRFNMVDELVLHRLYDKALPILDTIELNYDFIYARHCVKSLQICLVSNDSIRAEKWLKRCMLQGVPKWYLRNLPSTKGTSKYHSCKLLMRKYDSFYCIYRSRINHQLADQIDSMIETDQRLTKKVNDGFILTRHTYHGLKWLNNNRRQFEALKSIIQTYGYPGEHLIGLPEIWNDSTLFMNQERFEILYLNETRAFIMLLHCYSNRRENINNILLKQVEIGNLPSYQYASINDFIARKTKDPLKREYFNQWHTDPDTANLIKIDKRRDSIGLNIYELKQRNDKLINARRRNKSDIYSIYLE